MVEALGTHGPRCERCGHVHASIERAVRYHMARYWVLPLGKEQQNEMDFISDLKMGLPPGVNISVRMSEARRILQERDG